MSIRKMLLDALEKNTDHLVVKELNGKEFGLQELKRDVLALEKALSVQIDSPSNTIIGIAMRSSYDWVKTFLAALKFGAVILPVPLDFTDEQISSLLGKASLVITNDHLVQERIAKILPSKQIFNSCGMPLNRNPIQSASTIPEDIIAIIHTSGTTSSPKGVMIRDEGLGILVESLFTRVPSKPLSYLSVVPMSLLIEQVLGIVMPLLSGGHTVFMPKAFPEFGQGVQQAEQYIALFKDAKPNFGYLPPELLSCLSKQLDIKDKISLLGPNDPHFITGGTNVPEALLLDLQEKNIKVFEGYGLSENSSVVSLNYPDNNRIGSVGKPLPSNSCRIENGELIVKSSTLCAGYYSLDETSCDIIKDELHTGDLAEIKDEFIYIKGRKKHVIILANARNVSPEWVEKSYKKLPSVDDLVVIGDGKNHLSAIIFTKKGISSIQQEQTVINEMLPEFAQVKDCILVNDYDAFREKFYTVTGRPMREKIASFFYKSEPKELVA